MYTGRPSCNRVISEGNLLGVLMVAGAYHWEYCYDIILSFVNVSIITRLSVVIVVFMRTLLWVLLRHEDRERIDFRYRRLRQMSRWLPWMNSDRWSMSHWRFSGTLFRLNKHGILHNNLIVQFIKFRNTCIKDSMLWELLIAKLFVGVEMADADDAG